MREVTISELELIAGATTAGDIGMAAAAGWAGTVAGAAVGGLPGAAVGFVLGVTISIGYTLSGGTFGSISGTNYH
ncbi:hypothetical protein [Herbaspirillum sp. alder98]|uniref:hypothetical protein n=1 Tax=Herbaspirillum sp. alder98 TaxID=2913096 RepID=UPI001CD8E0F0|nr:hypothetical protein [Herbaspirillum sp. alder98]MCA1324528.1 hypothetical protein [Herbaspirillum sp. alder98]